MNASTMTALAASEGIREANAADVPRLFEMGLRFWRESPYRSTLSENHGAMTAIIQRLVDDPNGVVFVSVAAGVPVGMIGMLAFNHHISGELVAGELFWWTEPEVRGHGVRLLRRAERWAAANGARRIQMIAPNGRVGQLYERLGYDLIELGYQKNLAQSTGPTSCSTPRSSHAGVGNQVFVFDDVLPDPEAYRAAALARPFETLDVGAKFHGIAVCGDDPTLPDWMSEHFGLPSLLSFFRQSPEGQIEPNFIHTDCDMGEWTAILYLTPNPPPGDGTTFWRHTATGQIATTTGETSEANLAEVLAWRDRDQWEPWRTVEARFNRLLVFPAPYYHSRALEANYGAGETARLIQVLFGSGVLPQELPCV